MISASQLKQLMPSAGSKADLFAPILSNTASRFGVTTPKRLAAFLAMIAVECTELTRLVESFKYRDPARLAKLFRNDFADVIDAIEVHSRGQQAIANRVYANQNGNGDEASGDGWTYRGRGCPMITGRGNYEACGEGLGVDLVAHPELLEIPKFAADSAGWFWHANNVAPAADRGDIIAVTKIWNGGRNGLTERIEYFNRGLPIFANGGNE